MIIKILHIIIALNLFVSTIGVHIFEHSCKKNGSTYGIFIKPKSCCKSKKSNCNLNKNCSIKEDKKFPEELSKNPCCRDLTHFVKDVIPGLKQAPIFSLKQVYKSVFVFSITTFNALTANIDLLSKISYQNYKPPQIILDICQIFRVIRC